MPYWTKLLLLSVFLNGILLASIRQPWFGEDEVNHEGYIEALAQDNSWFLFETNLASVALNISRQLVSMPQYRSAYLDYIKSADFQIFRRVYSVHQNATAYQPPLYYYGMSLPYRLLSRIDLISLSYIMRYVQVGIGLIYVWVCYKLLNLLNIAPPFQILGLSLLAFLPLRVLLASTISVQNWVFLLYGFMFLLMRTLLNNPNRTWVHVQFSFLIFLGLLSQQAFYAPPVWYLGVLIWLVYTSRIKLKQFGFGLLCLALVLGLALPQQLKRHKQVDYVVSRENQVVTDMALWQYPIQEWYRLKSEAVYHFFDMHNSFLPFQSSATALNLAHIFEVLGIVGFVAWLLGKSSLTANDKAFIVSSLLISSLFVAGHGWFDFFQLRFGEQQYFKARYLYPLLPLILWVYAKGWQEWQRHVSLHPSVLLMIVLTHVFLLESATVWFIVHISS